MSPDAYLLPHVFSAHAGNLAGLFKLRKGSEAEAQNRGLAGLNRTPRAVVPSTTGGMGPATQPQHLILEATGV